MTGRDPEVTSRIMASVSSKDTEPEVVVRKRLWRRGYRYRKHYDEVKGNPDLAFVGPKIAVFIDGDFWHGNAWKVRGYDSLEDLFPTNTEWWVNKIQRNMERDEEVNETLRDRGWTVLRFWSSEVKDDVEAVVDQIARQVDSKTVTD